MAARIEFHTHLDDPLAYACRLLRKALRQGHELICTAPEPLIGTLDRALWTFEEREFLPHVRLPGAASGLAARTPLWLSTQWMEAASQRLLVNLGADWAPAALPNPRIVELVGASHDAAAAGRARWRAYREAGLDIDHRRGSAGAEGASA